MLGRILKVVEDVLEVISATLVFIMMIFVVFIIIARLFGYGIVGYIDVIELLLPAVTVLGISALQRRNEHLGMDLLIEEIQSSCVRKCIKIISLLIGLFVVVVLSSKTFQHFMRAYSVGDSTIDAQISTWPSKGILPLALSILAIRFIIQIFDEIRWKRPAEGGR